MEATTLNQKLFRSFLMILLSSALFIQPAMADGILFSDLGPPGDVYDSGAWITGGLGVGPGPAPSSLSQAQLFTVSGSGSIAVSQIDLAIGNSYGPNTFEASIWTNSGNSPGTQVAGAEWSLSTNNHFGVCCDLVSVTGISGVTLTGGQQYFMIVGPLDRSINSENDWQFNSQNVTGLDLYSVDGGANWISSESTSLLSAFDVLSTPEPGSMVLLGTGLLMLGIVRMRVIQRGNKATLRNTKQ